MGEGSHKYGSGRGNRPKRNDPVKKPALSAKSGLSAEERRKRGEARLRAKGDINSGLTKAQKAAVERFENKHRDYKTERVTAIDTNGRIVAQSTKGTRNQTRIPGYIPENCVITHNHPSAANGKSTAMGGSISGQDLGTSIYRNAAEIRAVSGQYTYSVRRPRNGWNADPVQVVNRWRSSYNRHIKDLTEYMNSGKDFNTRVERYRRLNTLASHMATRDIAKKYGMEYTRKRTKK